MSKTDESKRLLMTGATGFVGSHCLAPLLLEGYEVHAISTRSGLKADSSIVWHQADILGGGSNRHLMESVKPTHLLHLAWYVVPGKSMVSDLNFDWVRSSMELLRAFQQQGGRRVVMSGSSFEYDGNYGYSHETRTPTAPNTIYGSCKHALEVMVSAFCRAHGISYAWPRIFSVYGPNEHPNRLVASVIRSVLLGQEARCSHGKQVRDYLHVQDVADAIVSVLDNEIEGVINIGSGTAVTLRDVSMTIGRILKREDLIKLGAIPSRTNEAQLVVADVERLVNEIQWHPRFSLDEGLNDTIEWWRQALRRRN